jgi:hypothetical protein
MRLQLNVGDRLALDIELGKLEMCVQLWIVERALPLHLKRNHAGRRPVAVRHRLKLFQPDACR